METLFRLADDGPRSVGAEWLGPPHPRTPLPVPALKVALGVILSLSAWRMFRDKR